MYSRTIANVLVDIVNLEGEKETENIGPYNLEMHVKEMDEQTKPNKTDALIPNRMSQFLVSSRFSITKIPE